jgi:hypothetical protein
VIASSGRISRKSKERGMGDGEQEQGLGELLQAD